MADKLAAVKHEDLIGVPDGADALGDDNFCGVGQLAGKAFAQGGEGLGAMWGQEKATEMLRDAGFEVTSVEHFYDDGVPRPLGADSLGVAVRTG